MAVSFLRGSSRDTQLVPRHSAKHVGAGLASLVAGSDQGTLGCGLVCVSGAKNPKALLSWSKQALGPPQIRGCNLKHCTASCRSLRPPRVTGGGIGGGIAEGARACHADADQVGRPVSGSRGWVTASDGNVSPKVGRRVHLASHRRPPERLQGSAPVFTHHEASWVATRAMLGSVPSMGQGVTGAPGAGGGWGCRSGWDWTWSAPEVPV